MIDFTKSLDLKVLKERYLGVEIVLEKREFIIDDLKEVKNGVKIKMRERSTNRSGFAIDSKTKEDVIFTLEDCEKVILKCWK